MINADLNWLTKTLGVTPISPRSGDSIDGSASIGNISTDSRTITDGQVFLALKGPNFDGSKFVEQVKNKGAIAVIVHEAQECDIIQYVVPDTLKALGALGKAVAQNVAPKVIAMTGSVGKTSVKEMCAAIMSQKGNVLATNGNFNNEIGVPLTLLRLEPQHEYAIIELGANHIGEIAYTTSLTQPDVAILNNVAEAHLEGFGSLQGVVEAKGEIFYSLKPNGVAIVNGDETPEHKRYWLNNLACQFEKTPGRVVEFGGADDMLTSTRESNERVFATEVKLDATGCAQFTLNVRADGSSSHSIDVKLTVPGEHNVKNALAATAACMQLGASLKEIKEGLSTMAVVAGRVNLKPVNDKLLLIDDSYNANVQSVKAAIDLLATYPSHQILVLGDMAELGDDAQRFHKEVGEYCLDKGVDQLYSFGVLSQAASSVFKQHGHHFSSKHVLVETLIDQIKQVNGADLPSHGNKVTVLVKGSRSAKMELVIEQVIAQHINTNKNKGR